MKPRVTEPQPAFLQKLSKAGFAVIVPFLYINTYPRIYCPVKTTVDLPDDILERTKIAAAKRRTSIKNLIIEGLETVLRENAVVAPPYKGLDRLRKGYHLGGNC